MVEGDRFKLNAKEPEDFKMNWRLLFYILMIIIALIFALMAGCPAYNVYTSRLEGEAILAKSQASRQALVSQAQAEKDAAKLRADAISIVGKAAKEFPEYREQEFIGAFADALQNGKISQIIYVPTERNIPIVRTSETPNHEK